MSFKAYEQLKKKPIGLIALKPTDTLVVDKKNGLLYCVGFILAQTDQDEPDDLATQLDHKRNKWLRTRQCYRSERPKGTDGTAESSPLSQNSNQGNDSTKSHLTDKQPDSTKADDRERQYITDKLKERVSFSSQAKELSCAPSIPPGSTSDDAGIYDTPTKQLKDIVSTAFDLPTHSLQHPCTLQKLPETIHDNYKGIVTTDVLLPPPNLSDSSCPTIRETLPSNDDLSSPILELNSKSDLLTISSSLDSKLPSARPKETLAASGLLDIRGTQDIELSKPKTSLKDIFRDEPSSSRSWATSSNSHSNDTFGIQSQDSSMEKILHNAEDVDLEIQQALAESFKDLHVSKSSPLFDLPAKNTTSTVSWADDDEDIPSENANEPPLKIASQLLVEISKSGIGEQNYEQTEFVLASSEDKFSSTVIDQLHGGIQNIPEVSKETPTQESVKICREETPPVSLQSTRESIDKRQEFPPQQESMSSFSPLPSISSSPVASPSKQINFKGKQISTEPSGLKTLDLLPKSKILCRAVQLNKVCRSGSACNYAHNLFTGICHFFAQDDCQHGIKCRFSYNIDDISSIQQFGRGAWTDPANEVTRSSDEDELKQKDQTQKTTAFPSTSLIAAKKNASNHKPKTSSNRTQQVSLGLQIIQQRERNQAERDVLLTQSNIEQEKSARSANLVSSKEPSLRQQSPKKKSGINSTQKSIASPGLLNIQRLEGEKAKQNTSPKQQNIACDKSEQTRDRCVNKNSALEQPKVELGHGKHGEYGVQKSTVSLDLQLVQMKKREQAERASVLSKQRNIKEEIPTRTTNLSASHIPGSKWRVDKSKHSKQGSQNSSISLGLLNIQRIEREQAEQASVPLKQQSTEQEKKEKTSKSTGLDKGVYMTPPQKKQDTRPMAKQAGMSVSMHAASARLAGSSHSSPQTVSTPSSPPRQATNIDKAKNAASGRSLQSPGLGRSRRAS